MSEITSTTPAAIARLRNDAGGLICCALSHAACAALGLPFARDALDLVMLEPTMESYIGREFLALGDGAKLRKHRPVAYQVELHPPSPK